MSNGQRPPPSNPTRVITRPIGSQEFTARFYPGFARTIRVNGEVLYDQAQDGPDPFVLPPGSDRPYPMSSVTLQRAGGPPVTITIDDPDQTVAQVEVFLRAPEAQAAPGGGVTAFQVGGDTVTIDNHPTLCPPVC